MRDLLVKLSYMQVYTIISHDRGRRGVGWAWGVEVDRFFTDDR